VTVADSRIDDLRRRLERDPGSRLFAQLAEEHRKAGDHSEAVRVARAGLAVHPSYPSARLTLGRALLDSGDAAGARVELEATLRDAPDNILASRFLGQALEALGELGPALDQLQRTLKMAPGDRQLEGQIVSLKSRLGAPGGAAAPAGRAPAAPTAGPRPQVPPPAEEEAPEGPLPPTIRIRPAGESGNWGRRAPAPPPLPPAAAPAVAAPPKAIPAVAADPAPALPAPPSPATQTPSSPPLPPSVPPSSPPPPPAAPAPPRVAAPAGATVPTRVGAPAPPAPTLPLRPATGDVPLSAEPFYESDVAPTMPTARSHDFDTQDVTGAPTVPPGAVTVEETVFEAEVEEPPPALTPGEPAAPVAAAAAAPEPSAESVAPLSSSTLAELYFRQGLVGRAVEVYRQVVGEEPANERARARLLELESLPPPADERASRRRTIERQILGLEALLAVVRRR
jgi:tetratricopeptide (TPR) repeat protein